MIVSKAHVAPQQVASLIHPKKGTVYVNLQDVVSGLMRDYMENTDDMIKRYLKLKVSVYQRLLDEEKGDAS